MARYSKKSQYTKVEDRVIYVLHAAESTKFYVSHCRKDLLKDVYKDHLRGERYKTCAFTAARKAQNTRPCVHILEELSCTKLDAYHHVIAWTKIFVDRGFESLDQGDVVCYAQEMFDDTLAIYRQNKDVVLKQILQCRNCIVKIYNRETCQKYKEVNDE